MDLEKIAPPNLPLSPAAEVTPHFFEQFSNILRLFFTRLVKSYNALVGSQIANGEGGAALYFPYAEFSSHVDQTTTANTATQVELEVTDYSAGISVASNVITFAVAGYYNVFSNAVFINDDVIGKTVRLWLKINGADDPNTCVITTIPAIAGASSGANQVAFSTIHPFDVNDTLEFYWATEDVDVYLHAEPALAAPYVAPAGFSFLTTITFMSNGAA